MKMKGIKKQTYVLLAILLMGFALPQGLVHAKTTDIPVSSTAPTDSNLNDTLLALLTPSIDDAVKARYGKPQQYDLFNAKIDKIDRPQKGGFHFIVTVTIQTFEGAHNPPYGHDTFTFDVTPEKVTLLSSKHHEVNAQL